MSFLVSVLSSVAGKIGMAVLAAALLGGLYLKVTADAFDRGYASRDAEAREIISKMEKRLAAQMKRNEGLTDPELDCALMRLRNPKAECK